MFLNKILRSGAVSAAVAVALSFPLAAQADTVTVFAAASLKNALDAVAKQWEAKTGNEADISYAGSSKLAQQIMAGAPADVYLSANVGWMDKVEKQGLIAKGERSDLLGNSLVLIAHGKDAKKITIDKSLDLPKLLGDGKLAMALVNSVPAGIYGKTALTSLGMWKTVEPHVAQADNVRAALALVDTGEAPYGIVYSTDAMIDKGVSIAGTFPADSHPPIIYPAAVLKDAKGPTAKAFYEALSTPEAAKTFESYGFKVLKK
ncbi:molybdate ABC transporter substrate-binding protein [Acidimangrovimonas sediminis]|uniref:molybdate ABC transporter substrate-binding protein n=1 Tax=Acidimangrovimonas sediminis TaxID=2056283 RepID=UPI000C80B985|nr:molybdate ABC transporter substrate-binding protein [Acidimangrovimonas sediminis]